MAIRVLDMFCGAGGSSCGAALAGAQIVGAVDAWAPAAHTLLDNYPDAKVVVRRLGPRSRVPKDFLGERIDLLLASPECTNHSPAKGAAPRSEESKRTANYILTFARTLEPRWIVIENVVQMRNWSGFEPLRQRLKSLGYATRVQALDASDFGVPQSRRRLFVIGDLCGEPPEIRRPQSLTSGDARSVVDWEARWPSTPLRDKRPATRERARRAISVLGKGVPFLLVYYGSDGSGGWQPLDRPIRTLTTLDRFGLVTWRGSTPVLRMLQVDELKRAMGFPERYRFERGSRRDQVRMLGNGVCPPVMSAVVSQLAS